MILKLVAIMVLAMTVLATSVPAVGADSIADHVVISEIQAHGDSEDDDWIELYNPTTEAIELAAGNYRIERAKTATDPDIVMRIGEAGDGTYPGGTTIPAHGFYLIVRDDASQALRNKADAIGTRGEYKWLGDGYTLYLGNAAISSDDDSDIIDKVGFGGSATYYETLPAPEISVGKSIQRKVDDTINYQYPYGPAWDSDDNSADFFVQDSPNPANSAACSANPMYPIPEFSTITLFASCMLALAGYILLRKRRR